jgi:hypothetical protein
MAPKSDEEWTFRVHQKDVAAVLRLGLIAGDDMVRARAVALVHRYGRVGLVELGDLLKAAPPKETTS